jgi:CTP:molybdopterin cytidylyltransferase MocA
MELPTPARLRVGAIVLAAGAGSRFSDRPGEKLLAELDARPLLEHVLGAVRAFRPVRTVVVLGSGAPVVRAAIGWRGETVVRNRWASKGLASSIRLGLRTIERVASDVDAVLIVLGDQPTVRAEVMAALADAAIETRQAAGIRGFIVPTYGSAGWRSMISGGPRNPVLVLRHAWPAIRRLKGDRGLGPYLDEHPEEVVEVAVEGALPDIDTPADLEALRRGAHV